MANIEIFGTLVRNDNGINRDKIVQGSQVEGGYFVCETLPTQGTWTKGQLCYVTGTSASPINEFYQYSGTAWVEKVFEHAIATSDKEGLVKIGYVENGKNYPVELSDGKMFVNVPWTDTNTDTIYEHPGHTAYSKGLYKVTVDDEGHVTEATAVVKKDITDLGIPALDTTYTSESAVANGTTVSLVTTGEKYTWNAKQDSISDLATIRSGAAAGAKALQPEALASYVTTTDPRLSDARTPTAHNQASNTINAMTGYNKPSSTDEITSEDSLNTAIGKLEKGLDEKQATLSTQIAYTSKGSATKVPQITTNSLGQVTSISEVTITQPTVNNGTLTIQKNGTTVQTFTANQSGDITANITVPIKVSELTNDSFEEITSSDITDAFNGIFPEYAPFSTESE